MLLCCCDSAGGKVQPIVRMSSLSHPKEASVESFTSQKNPTRAPACPGKPPVLGETFTVTVVKTDSSKEIGMCLSMVDSVGLLVHTVKEGLINDWNLRRPDLMVLQYDCIYEVNGQTGPPSELLRMLKSEVELTLTVRRCETICVQFNQRDEWRGLGLGFDYNASSMTLPINSVRDGLITDWNEEDPSQAVRVGDVIVVVNGVCGSASKMLGKIRTESSFCLIVLRPPGSAVLFQK